METNVQTYQKLQRCVHKAFPEPKGMSNKTALVLKLLELGHVILILQSCSIAEQDVPK